jgi:acetylornithine deacetylase/succinyl-diaminopimelate desuccinylase-like protein
MARLIPELERSLPELHHPLLGGPTLNVGTISGGAKVNVIPASCSVEIDRRTLPGESSADVVAGIEAAVERARTRLPGLSVTVETIAACDPFELPADSLVVQAARAAAAEATGGAAEVVGFRGASDARFLAQAGAETIVWGPGDITLAHTARESIELAEVETAAVAYALAFARLLAPAGGAS